MGAFLVFFCKSKMRKTGPFSWKIIEIKVGYIFPVFYDYMHLQDLWNISFYKNNSKFVWPPSMIDRKFFFVLQIFVRKNYTDLSILKLIKQKKIFWVWRNKETFHGIHQLIQIVTLICVKNSDKTTITEK